MLKLKIPVVLLILILCHAMDLTVIRSDQRPWLRTSSFSRLNLTAKANLDSETEAAPHSFNRSSNFEGALKEKLEPHSGRPWWRFPLGVVAISVAVTIVLCICGCGEFVVFCAWIIFRCLLLPFQCLFWIFEKCCPCSVTVSTSTAASTPAVIYDAEQEDVNIPV